MKTSLLRFYECYLTTRLCLCGCRFPVPQVRVLYFVGRALLKEDRPTFALHLVHGMHPELFQPVSLLVSSLPVRGIMSVKLQMRRRA